MKIKKGNYRTVLLIGPVAIKFIRISSLGKFFKLTQNDIHLLTFRLIRSFIMNITEWFIFIALSQRSAVSFLAPTYFSCGFFNIQKNVKGKQVDCRIVMDIIMQSIPESHKGLWMRGESHSFWANSGWRLCGNQYILLDYGDFFGNGTTFSEVFLRDWEYLEKCLTINPNDSNTHL